MIVKKILKKTVLFDKLKEVDCVARYNILSLKKDLE